MIKNTYFTLQATTAPRHQSLNLVSIVIFGQKFICKIWYSTSQTMSDDHAYSISLILYDDAHRSHAAVRCHQICVWWSPFQRYEARDIALEALKSIVSMQLNNDVFGAS